MVNLKDSIVIKNQFTNKNHSGFGKTVNRYIMRYVSRKDATEALTPIQESKFSAGSYVLDYMTRRDATEELKTLGIGPEQLTYESEKAIGFDGRGFGSEGISYSDEVLREKADEMQKLFESGHTVLKTVLSFRTNYLQDLGILPGDFVPNGRGSFKGQVDQLKLRQAISGGMDALTASSGFSEPLWVATIQVDTNHVHAHVVTSERGSRENMVDGEERGKLSAKDKEQFRMRFDSTARELNPMISYNQQVLQSRQELINDVVNVVSQDYTTSSKLQLLIASLPEDTKYWRHGSNAKVMQKPNQLMQEYLQTLVESPKLSKVFIKAREDINKYADRRKELYDIPKKKSVEKGLSILEERLENGIYGHLKRRRLKLDTSTEYLKSQAEDDNILKAKLQTKNAEDVSSLDLLAYRMNQYRERLNRHAEAEASYAENVEVYDDAYEKGEVSPESKVVREFYHFNYETQAQLADKYRYLIGSDFSPIDQQALMPERNRLHETFLRLDMINKYRGYYGVSSPDAYNEILVGDYLTAYDLDTLQDIGSNKGVPKSRFDKLERRLTDVGLDDTVFYVDVPDNQFKVQRDLYVSELIEFNKKARKRGLVTHQAILFDDGTLPDVESLNINQELTKEIFDNVKSLDIPELAYDFDLNSSRKISDKALNTFTHRVSESRAKYDSLVDYLSATGQSSDNFAGYEEGLVENETHVLNMTLTMELPDISAEFSNYEASRNFDSISLSVSRKQKLAHEALAIEQSLELSAELENQLLLEEAQQTVVDKTPATESDAEVSAKGLTE